jgi:UDP-3-O-[3-hydroxymyristoyl] glucosamine N-acyltransferase
MVYHRYFATLCVFGGQVGIVGHLTIGDKVTIAAQSEIMRDIESGVKIAGSPGVNIMNWHRQNVIPKASGKNRVYQKIFDH